MHEWKHPCAILKQDFAAEWDDLCDVLTGFRLQRSWIEVGGGRKSKVSESIDSALYTRGWVEKKFKTEIVVDGARSESPTHQIDCFKNRVALEIEWNNKDPFFDRDLNNFRLLFELRAVSVGVIVTRCDELQKIFDGSRQKLWLLDHTHGAAAASHRGWWRWRVPDPGFRNSKGTLG